MFTLIDTLEDLAFLNKELQQKDYIGVDTEFRRTTKTNMKLALLQINDGEEIYLIDTLSIIDPLEHASFLHKSSVTKILHSCKEDLEAIYSWTNQLMNNIVSQVRVPRVNSQGKVKTFKCKQCEFVAVTKVEFWKHGRGMQSFFLYFESLQSRAKSNSHFKYTKK